MATKLSEKNTVLWAKFYDLRLSQVLANQKVKNLNSARINVNQYKVLVTFLDKLTDDLENATVEQLREAKQAKPDKANHITGFFIECVEKGWLELSGDVLVELIPIKYRIIAEKLLGK